MFFIAIILSLFCISGLASADTLGQKESFYVNSNFDKYSRSNLTATLKYVGGKTYVYVEDSYWNNINPVVRNSLLSNMTHLAGEFENNIYPKEVNFWGSEPNPGIDGDSHITLLLEELVTGNGGYFDSTHGYSSSQVSGSNEREMITLSVDVVQANGDLPKFFLAHEFHHLISFNQKELLRNITEDIWLNELRAEYSISLVGYNNPYTGSSLERRVSSFLESPSDSLTEWPNKSSDYAIVNLFGEYLVEQFGQDILSASLRSYSEGISSINNFLIERGHQERFADIFLNWMAAVYLNDNLRDSRLGYVNPNLKTVRVRPQEDVTISSSTAGYSSLQSIKVWQPIWLEFDLVGFEDINKSLKLDISSQTGRSVIASYLAFYGDGSVQFGRAITGATGTTYVLNSDKILKKLVVMATDNTKSADFTANEPTGIFSARVSPIETTQVESTVLKDGALIKRPVEKEIYVIWGKYRRYLMPGVISLYGHLNPADAIELQSAAFDLYTTSNYVRHVNGTKVYAVWPDGTKHWLNITPEQWDASRRDWNSIFIINDLELNYYTTGPDITR